MAKEKAQALSAYSALADRANPPVVEAVREVGIAISQNKPELLTFEMIEKVDKTITVGCENTYPITTVETGDWSLEDPKRKLPEQVRKIPDAIRDKIAKLAGEVTAR